MAIPGLLEKLNQLLAAELPGKDAWEKMAPEHVRIPLSVKPLRKAAVMILLYPSDIEISFILIKRTQDNSAHSGQISLPGGMAEPDDENLRETAIRETEEELGINGKDIIISGNLTELLIPVSHTEVTPFVGFLTYHPVFLPDPDEVDYIIEVPVKKIADPAIIKSEYRLIRGESVMVPYFEINDEKIWGATAMILSEFITLLQGVGQ